MSKFPVVAVIVIILVAGAAYFFSTYPRTLDTNKAVSPSPVSVSNISETQSPASESSPVASGSLGLGAGGSSYLDSSKTYSFLYPNDFKLDESDPNHIRFYKQGPTQKGQTEMYDGVVMVLEVVDLGNKTLSVWIDDYINTVTADGTSEVTEAKKATTISNYLAFSFKMRGLGESQYYVLQKDASSKNAVIITYMVADPTNVGFQKQVDASLGTIQLLK